jgi:surface antigen
VPLRNFQDTSGHYCREYQRMANIGGVPQQVYGTACILPDGSWPIVNE